MPDSPTGPDPRIAVVLVTHRGRERIGRSLDELSTLPARPRIVVVDNASDDGTADHVAARWPAVTVLRLAENLGVGARNAGVAAAGTPYVAFAEDDSWYEPGALRRAADVLDAHPRVGLVQAHVLVGAERRDDPIHDEMVGSPLDGDGGPGHRIVSFLEGVSVVRRAAYEDAGGFPPHLFLGGPEEHLAAELLRRGWELRYVPDVVARHWPDHGEPGELVRRLGLRNTLWNAWLRRPLGPALRWTATVLRSSVPSRATVAGALDAVRGLPRVVRERNPLPAPVERDLARVDPARRDAARERYRPSDI